MDIWKTMQFDDGIKELEQQFMDLDAAFKFKCRQCGSAKKTHTVREWLASFGIPEHDEFFYLWTGIQLKLRLLIRELESKGISGKAQQPVWNVIFTGLYIACNIGGGIHTTI